MKTKIITAIICCQLMLPAKTVKISYLEDYSGKQNEQSRATTVITDGKLAEIIPIEERDRMRSFVPLERSFIDYTQKEILETAQLGTDNREQVYYTQEFDSAQTGQTVLDSTKILGYTCKKLRRIINSNTIDIFYTSEDSLRGTPRLSLAAIPGLVLKIIINGNYEICAQKIEIIPEKVVLPTDPGLKICSSEYDKKISQCYVNTIPVFYNEQISFGNQITKSPTSSINQTLRYAGGTVILKKVSLPQIENGDQIFIELTEKSRGDAYDRTGSVFIIPVDRKISFLQALEKDAAVLPIFNAANGKKYQGMQQTADYLPPIELLRFFTPFGVGHYSKKSGSSNWDDSVKYKQEITHLQAALKGQVLIGVFIGNYDKGGHEVSLDLKLYPGSKEISSEEPSKEWISPLFNTVNIMEMAGQEYGTLFDRDSLTVNFEIPPQVTNLKLYYTTTGHGGWSNGDEFNQKQNEVFIDGQPVFVYTPWRTDCGTYRSRNPASGNFWNGLSSSDLSRSGWCPGTATPPDIISLKNLQPGRHTIKVAIMQGAPENGSFSAWNISGILVGEYKK